MQKSSPKMGPDTPGLWRRALLIAALGATYALLPRVLDRAATLIERPAARIEGAFVENGDLPASRGFAPDGVRLEGGARDSRPPSGAPYWSSWGGSNAGKGSLLLGPFTAPSVLALEVCGYTHVEGSRLFLENTATGERTELTHGNIGPAWCDLRVRLPAAWVGRPVTLRARDDATGLYGWLAVGSPRSASAATAGWNPFAQKLLVFTGAGLALILLQSSGASLVRRHARVPEALVPLVSLGLVALLGYVVFWIFSASVAAGKGAAWGLLAAAAVRWILRGPSGSTETRASLGMMAAVGFCYFGLLTLYGSDRSLSETASFRYLDTLIYDNELPHMFADKILHGEDSRHLLFGWWLSTDRPPLQTGCDLLAAYPLSVLWGTFEAASQAVGMWLQLLWVCAAWGWLRTMGRSVKASAVTIAVLAPCGFLIVNSLFVWPKLMAAALLLGAFCLWIDENPSDGAPGTRRSATIGALGALSFLAHSSCAFSILGWIPLEFARTRRRRLAPWIPAAAAFAALVLPWLAYQKFYNPPGNTMIKRHLAGVEGFDSRGTAQALADAYRSTDLGTLLHNRIVNMKTLLGGPGSGWTHFGGADLASRRTSEYFGLFSALGWWNLGFVAAAFLIVLQATGVPQGPFDAWFRTSLWWCGLTLACWLLLMFQPESTVIHQSSYAMVLLFLLCAAWVLRRTSLLAFSVAAAGCLLDFLQLWIAPNPARATPLDTEAALFTLLAVAALVAAVACLPGEAAKQKDPG